MSGGGSVGHSFPYHGMFALLIQKGEIRNMKIRMGLGELFGQMIKRGSKIVSLIVAASLALSFSDETVEADASTERGTYQNTVTNGGSAEEKTDGETGYTYILQEVTGEEGEAARRAVITGYEGSGKALEIPKELGGCKVRGIGDGAFRENPDITSAAIPEGVESIGFEAFRGCGKLAKVMIPASITDWNDHTGNGYRSSAFEDCTALAELVLAEGLTVLGQRAFAGCTALEGVTVPATVETFHAEVFADCMGLASLELREGIREIGYHAFAGCASLKEVRIPSTVENWAVIRANGIMATPHACAPFSRCTSLEKIEFAPGLKSLSGFEGVPGCPGVTELTVPDSVQDIKYAFAGCDYLEKVTLGKGIEKIGQSAFEGCSRLVDVQIPYTVTEVGASAFKDCTALERLVFPPSAVKLEGSITYGCSNLKECYLLAGAVSWYQTLHLPSGGKLYCMEGSSTYGNYLSAMPGEEKKKLAVVPSAGVEAEGCSVAYDGSAHKVAQVKGIREGDQILYRLNEGSYQEEMPEMTEPGSTTVEIAVRRILSEGTLQYSNLRVQVQIRKRQYGMRLQDIEVEEGEAYEVAVQGYEGNGTPVYAYFKDAGCIQSWDGKPEAAGVYYVRASVPEMEYDAPVESNVAKITIYPTASPGGDSGADASASPSPSGTPGGNPSASQKPGENPSASQKPDGNPSPSQMPGSIPTASAQPGQVREPGKQAGIKVRRATIKKVKIKKKTLLVQWKILGGVKGYQVQIAANKKFTKGKRTFLIRGVKKGKKLVRKLKGGKRYFVRVRAYKTDKGKKRYGGWSKAKSAKA